MKRWFVFCFYLLIFTPMAVFAQIAPSFEEGRDYIVLPDNDSTKNLQDKNQVKVVEFFSYGCPACFKLEPHLEKWLQHKPKNILFERIPVVFESGWEVYARTYLILSSLNLDKALSPKIFIGVHVDNLDLTDKNSMAAFLNTQGITKEKYLALYDSPSLDLSLSNDKKIANDYKIFQIPGIVVDGKYKVDPSLSGPNYDRLFLTVDYLIHKEKKSNSIK